MSEWQSLEHNVNQPSPPHFFLVYGAPTTVLYCTLLYSIENSGEDSVSKLYYWDLWAVYVCVFVCVRARVRASRSLHGLCALCVNSGKKEETDYLKWVLYTLSFNLSEFDISI